MRIAQVAPPFESVPPSLYGGTERVVSFLTEELVRRGHQVTLFNRGRSENRLSGEAEIITGDRKDYAAFANTFADRTKKIKISKLNKGNKS